MTNYDFLEEKKLLKLTQITKHYVTGGSTVQALRGVDLEFRKNEFVSILGQSGCGKTTLLNIIGGLDRYTDGDLVINGKSTKTFKDSDWDSYRNHSIGFVFQSYNLIPHQTVLANVELALTLSGVSKKERRQRAIHALEQVGLGDQLHKKPNQMSGGQMQRVAIARALVNDPEILLADEPTGALDTATSVQIMEILKEISKDRLIIMVTHNPELAATYSTRIIKLLDGLVIDDTDPYTAPVEETASVVDAKAKKKKKEKTKKTSMSFFTALSLSLNNLATKKGRTMMTSFAGSIGIIGIAMILALSSGINLFISQIQEDTLSTYPLTIQKETQDMSAMLSAMTNVTNDKDYRDTNKIYIDNSMGNMLSAMSSTVRNDIESFKVYLDNNYDKIKDYVSDVQYTYDYDFQIYNLVTVKDENGKDVIEARKVGMETIFENAGEAFSGMSELMEMSGSTAGMNVFQEMIDNQDILNQQYEVVDGSWPKEANEVVLVISSNNQLSRMTLYMLGILDPDNIKGEMEEVLGGSFGSTSIPGTDITDESESETTVEKSEDGEGPYDFDYFIGMEFKLLTYDNFYVIDESKGTYEYNGETYPIWSDVREDISIDLVDYINKNGTTLKISGIVRPKEGATSTSISGSIGYTKELTALVLNSTDDSEIIDQQVKCYDETSKTGVNVLTGLPFERTHYTPETIHELISKIPPSTMSVFYSYMTEQILKNEEFSDMINVEDKQSFMSVFMLLPEDEQVRIFETILNHAMADPNNDTAIDTVCQLIAGMNGNDITITKQNIVKLLPILNFGSSLLAINGIPSLTDIVGKDDMQIIYDKINEKHSDGFSFMGQPLGSVTADNFVMILNVMDAEEKADVLGAIVDKAIEKDKTSVDSLCSIISATAGDVVTSENLKEKLPTMQFMAIGAAFTGIKGLASLAGDENMESVYAQTRESLMSLEVNDEMFLLILSSMSEDDETFKMIESTLYSMAPQVDETYESILEKLDNEIEASPASINFYAKDFDSKEKIEDFIKEYNNKVNEEYKKEYFAEHGKNPEGDSPSAIQYSDLVGALMSSVTTIVNVISYVLIAFVGISLVVSSIMIGIITNISVLERTKEIGILRAIGASKKDVSRVFNAETVIIGFCAGMIGVVSTSILCIPVTLILRYVTGFSNITAYVPFAAGVILVVISVLLTMIAGIIPARSAAKKDPVIALRTE